MVIWSHVSTETFEIVPIGIKHKLTLLIALRNIKYDDCTWRIKLYSVQFQCVALKHGVESQQWANFSVGLFFVGEGSFIWTKLYVH